MKSRISRKIFPFAPGIAWKIRNGKYVVPEIDGGTWSAVLENRDLVILAHGGLLEAFLSFAIVEALGRVEPSKRLFWAGPEAFKGVVEAHGKAQYFEAPDIGSKYPVPLFFDSSEHAYFNCLNNYLVERSYYGSHDKPDTSPVFQQVFRNSMLPWDSRYVPKLKSTNLTFENWAKNAKFHLNKKYVLVVPGRTGVSKHQLSCLNWSFRELRELAAMLRRFDVDVVLCIGEQNAVYNAPFIQAPRSLNVILPLIQKASVILASDIDLLLIGLATSKAAIIAAQDGSIDGFDLYTNAEFLGAENVIFTTDNMNPSEVYTMCEGIL